MSKVRDIATGLERWRDSITEKVKWFINILEGKEEYKS